MSAIADPSVLDQSPQVVGGRHLVFCPRTELAQFQVTDAVYVDEFAGSTFGATVDNMTGSVADLVPGMTIDVGTAPGLDDIGRLRLRGATDTGTGFWIITWNEISLGEMSIIEDTWMTVRDEFMPWPKMPKLITGQNLGIDYDDLFIELHDYIEVHIDQNVKIKPVINVTQGNNFYHIRYADPPDPGETYRELTVSVIKSESMVGGSLTFVWDIADCVLISGTLTSDTITIQVPMGFRHIYCTGTCSVGGVQLRVIPLWTEDEPLANFSIENDSTIDDREMTFEFRGQDDTITVDDIPRKTMFCYYETNVKFGDDDPPPEYVGQFLGWSIEESAELQKHRGMRSIVVQGPGHWMDTYDGFAQTIRDPRIDNPAAIVQMHHEMFDPTIPKVIHYIIREYTSLGPLINFYFLNNSIPSPGEEIKEASIWNQISELAKEERMSNARFDSCCALWLRQHFSHMDHTDRSSVAVVFTLESKHLPDARPIQLSRSLNPKVGYIEISGSTWTALTAAHYDSVAPSRTQSSGTGKSNLPYQRLSVTTPQDVLNQISGDAFAYENRDIKDSTIEPIGNLHVIEPAWGEPIIVNWVEPTAHGEELVSQLVLVDSVTVRHQNDIGQPHKSVSYKVNEVTEGSPGMAPPAPVISVTPPNYQPPYDRFPTYPTITGLLPNSLLTAETERLWHIMYRNHSAGEASLVTTLNSYTSETETTFASMGIPGVHAATQQDPYFPSRLWECTDEGVGIINNITGTPTWTPGGGDADFGLAGGDVVQSLWMHTNIAAQNFVFISLFALNGATNKHYFITTTDGANWNSVLHSNNTGWLVWVSAHSAGRVFVVDYTGTVWRIRKSEDYGATFPTTVYSTSGNEPIYGWHFPYHNNDDDEVFWFSTFFFDGGVSSISTYKYDHGVVTLFDSVIPNTSTGNTNIGPVGNRGFDTYSSNSSIMAMIGLRFGHGFPGGWALDTIAGGYTYSNDGGASWLPSVVGNTEQRGIAISGNNPLVRWTWGADGYITKSIDGATFSVLRSEITPSLMENAIVEFGGLP